ncbi:MAG: hypothetical protein MJK15_03855 [Colwellia sp.]|nr:hypothetical protein [Colwellia sp.]
MNTIADYISQKDEIEALKAKLSRSIMLVVYFRKKAYENKKPDRTDRAIDMMKAGITDNKVIGNACHISARTVAVIKCRFNKNDKR